jgi:uncharacterized protein
MLLVRTTVAPSGIHGLGVFAAEDIAAGQPVWEFAPGLDLVIAPERLGGLPAAFRAFLDTYGYRSPDVPDGGIVLSCDNAKYLNHAEDPNCESTGPLNRALRPIRAGEEITCDYRACVDGWTGF